MRHPAALIFILFVFLTGGAIRPAAVLAESKATMEQQLWSLEQEIAAYEKELAAAKVQKNTLANKIEELKKKRAKLQLAARSTKLKIKGAEGQIIVSEQNLQTEEKKLETIQGEISGLLRLIAQSDLFSPLKILFSSASLADFFVALEQDLILNRQLSQKMTKKKEIVKTIQDKLARLQDKKSDLKNLLTIQTLEEGEISEVKKDKEVLLQKTLGREAEYQKIVTNQKKTANEIRNRLYELAAVKAITFGEAVKIAEWVTSKIKIRPALLLSVITQESNLGKNVGTCNRPNDPPEKSWKAVMKPERDQEPYIAITKELGLDPDIQPVSCPMKDSKGKQIGWGGALGPAQFIPSTWQGYKGKVKNFTGQSIANPWDVRDAFVAAALLLAANGATSQDEKGEWKAAMIYFSGSTNTRFRFYGDKVVERAARYEEDIKNMGS